MLYNNLCEKLPNIVNILSFKHTAFVLAPTLQVTIYAAGCLKAATSMLLVRQHKIKQLNKMDK